MSGVKAYALMLLGLLIALLVLFTILGILGKLPVIGPFAQKVEKAASGQAML